MKLNTFLGLVVLLIAQIGSAAPLVRLQKSSFEPKSMLQKLETSAQQRTWLISFDKPITEAFKTEVAQQGFEILGFIPDASLIVRGERKENQKFNFQATWLPYQAGWKWSLSLPSPSVHNQSAYRVVMIRCHSKQDAKNLNSLLEKKDKVLILNTTDQYLVVRASYSDLFSLSNRDEVAFIDDLPDFKLMNMDLGLSFDSSLQPAPVSGFETGTKVMNMDSAWAQGFRGQGQVVAMGDTGLDRGDARNIHPDFENSIVSGRNFAPFGRSWEDPMGHGTHVAGSILGRGAASGGAFRGSAYEAGLVVHSLWSPMLNNLMVPTKLSDMFQAALSSGANFHTNSWGQARNFGGYDSFARQVDEFSFNNPELLILFAAGNSGVDLNKDGRIDADSIGSPGTAKNSLTVGASENYELAGGIQRKVSELGPAKENWSAEPIWSSKISDNAQGLAMFSSRGPTDDGRIKPEIVAPGTNILSTISRHPKAQVLWGKYNDDYVWSGGTSMSTPLVAGASAVTRQIIQNKFQVSKPSSSLVKAYIMAFAMDLYPGQYGDVGASRGQEILSLRPNSDEGFGLLNMKSQVEASSANTQLIDQTTGLGTGESLEYSAQLPQDGQLTVTLVWNDAPASENAGKALVNDLNLEISGPGVQFSSSDSVNNFEFFEKSARAGVYKIRVKGQQIPQGKAGKQPFSLVIRTL